MATTRTILPVASLLFPHENSKSALARSLNFKVNARDPTKISSKSFNARDGEVPSHSFSKSISFVMQVPDLDTIFNPIKFFEETTEIQDIVDCDMFIGRFVENGLVFRQSFSIRSYEIGAGGRISLEALMNYLQEAGLNHMKLTGLLGDRLGSTPWMTKKKLIWVATKVQLVIEQYPTWGDDVVIDNWIVPSGKNCMRRDSIIRDSKTGQILIRASNNWVMMNKETRRLSRIPMEVLEEMTPYLMDAVPIIEDDTNKLPKLDEGTSDSIVRRLKPRWSDLDINQLVNNTKYIGWVLESTPQAILKNHEISRVTMEYRRECHRDSKFELQSLTAVSGGLDCDFTDHSNVECNHMLKLEDGAEVMKARTEWRPKKVRAVGSL